MAGKNEKVDFLSEIGSLVNNQKEENQMLRRKKEEGKADEPALGVEPELEVGEQPVEVKEAGKTRGRSKQPSKAERIKQLNVMLDVNTHKALGRIKLEHDFGMREVAYIAIRKLLDEYMEGNELTEKGIKFIEKKLKELNGKV